jgi:hypothetical protein
MDREPDTTAAVRAWLRGEGPDNADRVLDAVLTELEALPQRRSKRMPVGVPSTGAGWLRYGLAAISLAAAMVIALSLLPHRVATPPVPTQTVSPTQAPTPSTSLPPRLPDSQLHGGRYTLFGSFRITIDVPNGGWGGFVSAAAAPAIFNDESPPRFASLRAANVTQMTLYLDPCRWDRSAIVQPKGGASIAAALSTLPGRAGTKPEQVSLMGTTAQHVRLTVPDGLATRETGGGSVSFVGCYGGQYRTWSSAAGDPRDQEAPGQIDDIYLIDHGDSTLLFDASYFPETSASDRRALEAMLRSLRIE